MWRSERCKTLRRLPDGFLGAGSGSGLGLANHPVRFSGVVAGSGQRPEMKCWQSICSRAKNSSISTRPRSADQQASNARARTDLPVEPSDVRVRDDLGDDRAERLDAELRRAVAVEAKVLAEPDRERGALLRRCHREELARLERGLAALAVVRPEHRVACDGEHLRERGLEELRRGRLGRQDVRVRCVVLYPYGGQQSATARAIT